MKELDLKRYCKTKTPIYFGAPTKKIYPIAETVAFSVIFILSIMADGFLAGATVFKEISGENTLLQIVLIAAAFLMHIVPLALWGLSIYKKFYLAKITYYILEKQAVKIVHAYENGDSTVDEMTNPTSFDLKKNALVFIKGEEKITLKYIANASDVARKFFEGVKQK
ncbi:MAG: hypothetical protein J6T42_00035 [Clostridia bacterium]|nr:hypothetical protein [Clostridia bacterium]